MSGQLVELMVEGVLGLAKLFEFGVNRPGHLSALADNVPVFDLEQLDQLVMELLPFLILLPERLLLTPRLGNVQDID